MKKIMVVLSLIICSCSTSPKYLSFDDALGTVTQKIQNDLPEGAQVAILDFKSDNENLSSYIIEEMYDKLINFGKLVIMERSRTNTMAMEVGYQLSGEVDDNEIVRIGHQLGADFVVTGQITFSGEAYRLRVFAIDIEKGRRVASSSLNINPNDRQINHLLTTRTVDNTRTIETNPNIRNNEEVLSIAVQNLFRNIPRNSRILLADFVGSNEFQPRFIQSVISDEAIGMTVITEQQRQVAINVQNEYLTGDSEFDGNLLGVMDGVNIIITGGVFGNRDTRRIVFRAVNVETRQIISQSFVLFRQNNTEFINNVEILSQKLIEGINNNVRNGTPIAVINELGTIRDTDFISDLIENNLVNLHKYRIVTRTKYISDLITKEQAFQFSGHVNQNHIIMIGNATGANIIISGDVFGNRDTHRIVYSAVNVETRQIVSESCVLFIRNNTEFINDAEALSQRINNGLINNVSDGATVAIINTIGTMRNADFIFDIVKYNLVNLSKHRIVTQTDSFLGLIRNELNFQWSGEVSEGTMLMLNRAFLPQYRINVELVNNRIQLKLIDVVRGNTITQETM